MNIDIIATTFSEGLFELHCEECGTSTLVSVLLETKIEKTPDVVEMLYSRSHRNISQNDILDIKNFLKGFDGNFKKIFTKKQR